MQEHRIAHEEEVKFQRIQNYHLVTSSAWRNKAQASQGGVGLLLSSRAKNALWSVESIMKRTLIAEFESNPVTTVIVIYAPTNVAPDDEALKFFENLKSVIAEVPKHNFLMILGDFNARLGSDDAPYTFHDEANRNGKLLSEVLVEHQLLAANTIFQKRQGKRWTFEDRASGLRQQLDYILVRKKWRNSVLNCEPYNTFGSVGSDHRVIGAKIRLSLRVSRKPRRNLLDWQEFSERPDLQEQYSILIRNRFRALQSDDNNLTEEYDKFVQVNDEAKEMFVPVKQRTSSKKKSDHPDVQRARECLHQRRMQYKQEDSDENSELARVAQEELFKAYRKVKEEELTQQSLMVEREHNEKRYGMAWKVVNSITGRKKSKEGLVKGDTPDQRRTTWLNHFSSLLGVAPEVGNPDEDIPSVFEGLDIPDGPFTLDEYQMVKNKLKRGKGAGPDDIPSEVLKYCDIDDLILEMCNRALLSGEKPSQWTRSNIVPIPKSGSLSNPSNYRGISLSCIIAKIYNRLILNRIRKVIDPLLRNNQNGFRSGRNTISQIMALRRIIEEAKEHNLPAILTFIDFKKAFDTIHRGKMLKILKAYGIPPRLLGAIHSMYKDTFAKVLTPDGETDWFRLLAGVLQGDTLAPFLFIIVLDYTLCKAIEGRETELGFTIKPRQSRRHPAQCQTDLDFADDISLLSDSISKAQKLLDVVQVECKKIGLKINASKTKFIALNSADNIKLMAGPEEEIERSEDFKYLGSHVMSSSKDIKVRKGKAWKALNDLSKIWKSDIARQVKARFFFATVESILLYGCETWTLTPSMEKSLDGAIHEC